MTSAHDQFDERIFLKECISLAKYDFDVYIVAKGNSVEKDGVHIVGIGDEPKSRLMRILRTSRSVYIKALVVDAEIYHIHDPELLPYALKLKRMGKKVIFDSHEDIPEQIMEKNWIPKPLRRITARAVQKYQNYVCKQLDAVISVTPHICNKLKLINPKTYMITNYPVLDEWTSVIDLNRNNRNRTICFAGGISEQWGHDGILNALDSIIDVKYNLCGFGSEDYIERLKTLKSWNKVDYKGRISHSEVFKLLSSSRIGMALLKKGWNTGGELGTLGNTKLFEYMLVGIPVICTNFSLWKEIVSEYNCGICVDPSDAEEITNAIKNLLDNPTIAGQMGVNGRKAVLEKYNWSGEEKKLLALYKEV